MSKSFAGYQDIAQKVGVTSAVEQLPKLKTLETKAFQRYSNKYVCQLCPHVENIYESEVYQHDGKCPVCNMNLIELRQPIASSNVQLHVGSGNYFIQGGKGNRQKLINVFYHKPQKFNDKSKVLIVIPGAGRNAWNYRDSWVEASEKHNVLILSPAYAERDYDFAAYHLGGTVTDLRFDNQKAFNEGKRTGKYIFKDEEILSKVNHSADTWIFDDFDRIFETAMAPLDSKQYQYDIFGHSAGGQILHRLAIFKPNSRANRIIAANSGSYTITNFENKLPFGLSNSVINNSHLKSSFSLQLTILVGELDNENETRGSLLHTPTVDKQGLGRVARSLYFYQKAAEQAETIGAKFNWQRKVVKGVGHDYRKMGKAAVTLLYAN